MTAAFTPAFGMLLTDVPRQRQVRIVAINDVRVSLMPLGSSKEFNSWMKRSDFDASVRDSVYVETVTEAASDVEPVRVPYGGESAERAGDERFARLRVALKDERILTAEGRAQLWKEMKAADSRLSKATFYRCVRVFLEGGMVPASLNSRRSGRKVGVDRTALEDISLADAIATAQRKSIAAQEKGKPKPGQAWESKAGEVRKRAANRSPTHYVVNDRETLRLFLEYYNKKIRHRRQLKTLYEEMRAEVFATKQPFGPALKWPTWSIPAFTTFAYYWRELIDYETRQVALHGRKKWDLSNRGKTGQSISHAFAAGRVGQLDATVWPIELVGEGDDAPLIGSPVVFRIRDKDTGQLLGLSVSLESASWYGAAAAIANCLEDKAAFCRRLGIEQLPLPWDIRGLPAEIHADLGETYNHKPMRFLRFTGLALSHMPGGRGDLKGGVESDFDGLQVSISEKTPGALLKECGPDLRLVKLRMGAQLTLNAFMRELVLAEQKKMHTPRRGLRLPDAMVTAGVPASPYAMFKWSERYGGGGLRRHDERLVRLSLLPVQNASINEDCLSVRGVRYECAPLTLVNAHAQARLKGRTTARVAYDPFLVNQVWLLEGSDEAPTAYVPAMLSTRWVAQRDWLGKTWREVLDLDNAAVLNNLESMANIEDGLDEIERLRARNRDESTARVKRARANFPASEAALMRQRDNARNEAKNEASPQSAIGRPLLPVEHPAAPVLALVNKQVHSTPRTENRSRHARLAASLQPAPKDDSSKASSQ